MSINDNNNDNDNDYDYEDDYDKKRLTLKKTTRETLEIFLLYHLQIISHFSFLRSTTTAMFLFTIPL